MDLAPRVPSQRDPVVDQGALASRAWFRFFQLLQSSIEGAALTQYTVVQNTTGVTIPKGTVVGFAGVGSNNVLSVAPYLADGSSPSLYILGIMAENLPDSGATGLCCVWGNVSGIDTSAFSVGDVLYVSPTVAGGLTATKPTAPDNVIPVAATLISSATAGDIFVRPTIEQQQYYGDFNKTNDQSPAVINTAYAITFDNTRIANGVSIGSPASRIVVSQSGLYQFNATVQISSGNSSSKNIYVWFRKNGADVPNSTRLVTIDVNNGYVPVTLIEAFSLEANAYVELIFASTDTAVTIDNVVATAFAPAAPAAVLSVTQLQQ
jgi:hypothetical protein